MNEILKSTKMTPEHAMEAGLSRARRQAAVHGINSKPVLETCIRWGAIIDDLNAAEAEAKEENGK